MSILIFDYYKNNYMRFLLVVFILCFGLSCKNDQTQDFNVQIDTYTPEQLTYPKGSSIDEKVKNEFINNYFLPWQVPANQLLDSLNLFAGKEIDYLEKYLNDDAWYGENKKPHTKKQREQTVANIDFQSFPNFMKKGITIAHTALRRIPTKKPGFDVYSKAGEGYPFDYFQETSLWANTPLFMVHLSNDKQWCYVISPYYKGWVAMHDLGIAGDYFIKSWLDNNYCHPLSDDLNLSNTTSNYSINTKIGMLLPYQEIDDKQDYITVYYAAADENQNAKILIAEVEKNSVAFNDLSFNEQSLEGLVSNLLGKPYGWGGYLENRDCSSMIRDLLGTFRIWLPRDSKDQMNLGHKYKFPESAEKKINLIKEKGIPFLTILRKPGHNMLYVGDNEKGEPLILHAIWGLKTSYTNQQLGQYLKTYPIEGIHQDEDGTLKGRQIIGEVVITSVNVGANSEYTPALIDIMYEMTNILEK
jgi:hypothetical protein